MGQAMYAAAGAEGASAGGPTDAAGETGSDDDVVDAEIVDEPTPGSEGGAE
jgi:molecular chaperone DnaK